MKKTISMSIILLIMTISLLISVEAENLYQQQPVYQNDSGQRVLDVTYNNGSLALRVLGRGSNIYNATNNLLITTSCKGPDYYCIAYDQQNNELIILWVDTAGILWRTPANRVENVSKGIYSGQVLNSISSSSTGNSATNGSTSYNYNTTNNTYSQGYNAGYNKGYSDGVNSNSYNSTTYSSDYNYANGYTAGYSVGYSQGQNASGYNYNGYNDKVVKDGNYYKVTVDGKTYEYKLSRDILTYKNTEISDDVDAIAFTDEYIIYFIGDEAYAVELGRKSEGDQILDDVEKVTYQSNGMLDYIKADGEKLDADDIEDLIDDDDDDDDDYPYVRKSSKKYTFYKSSSKKYVYTYDGDTVEYDGDTVECDGHDIDDIETIAFSEDGYLYILTENGNMYQLKCGKDYDEAKKVDSDIDRMKTSSYIVDYVYDNNKKIDIEDYE